MTGWMRQAIITFFTTAIISTVTTIASSQIALAVIDEKLRALDARTTVCELSINKIRDDIYRPNWEK